MQTDLLDQIGVIDPLPEDLPAPPIASLLALRERDASPARPRPARVRSAFPKRAALALPIAAALLGLALLGRGGDGQFDVAAAVYKATIAGNGVHYMFLEGEAGPVRIRYRRWSTTDPLRERDVIAERSRIVELVSGGGFESDWSTEHSRKILRVHSSAPLLNKWDPVRVIQEAYRAGRLHVLGKTTVGARAAYRAEILSSHGNATGPIVIVDAHTYMPIEMIYHGRGGSPTLVVHVRSYEEQPATKANLALMRLTHHAGARVVNVTRSARR
ncbi:MAG TPA: hypothetical protein VK691_03260 [Solirubrobacteraceae bacterium]|jgi:hypothetical protein|nr:hypothetical protein [Solirubrobacteraceae bacterium]